MKGWDYSDMEKTRVEHTGTRRECEAYIKGAQYSDMGEFWLEKNDE